MGTWANWVVPLDHYGNNLGPRVNGPLSSLARTSLFILHWNFMEKIASIMFLLDIAICGIH